MYKTQQISDMKMKWTEISSAQCDWDAVNTRGKKIKEEEAKIGYDHNILS